MRRVVALAAAVVCTGLSARPGGALTIDNFEQGGFVVTDLSVPSSATTAEQTGLSTTNVAGGVRLVSANSTFGTVSAVLATSALDDAVLMAPVTSGSVSYTY